jgi:hypothetical protein
MLSVGECVRLREGVEVGNPPRLAILRCIGTLGHVLKRNGINANNVSYYIGFVNGHSGRFFEQDLEVVTGKFKLGTKVRVNNLSNAHEHGLYRPVIALLNKVGTVSRFYQGGDEGRIGAGRIENVYEVKFTINKVMHRFNYPESMLQSAMKNEVTIVEED